MEKKKYIIVISLIFCFNGSFPVKCCPNWPGNSITDKVGKKLDGLSASKSPIVSFDRSKNVLQHFQKIKNKRKRGLRPLTYHIFKKTHSKPSYTKRDIALSLNPFFCSDQYMKMEQRGPPVI